MARRGRRVVGGVVGHGETVAGRVRLDRVVHAAGGQAGGQTFGLLGRFLGPVIMAAFLTVWREWVMPREPQSDGP